MAKRHALVQGKKVVFIGFVQEIEN